jgi:hypothetical protein
MHVIPWIHPRGSETLSSFSLYCVVHACSVHCMSMGGHRYWTFLSPLSDFELFSPIQISPILECALIGHLID